MSRSTKLMAITLAGVFSGCASQVPLPNNVTVTSGSGGGSYLDRIDFSYTAQGSRDFSKIKLCVAENIANNDASLRDSAGSFVGAYTGTYYQTNHTQTVSGKDVFKYVDDKASTLVASGTTISVSQQLISVKDIVKFELKAAAAGSNVTLQFFNITRAQQDTGMVANDGFNPVGVWSGARSQDVYASLEAVANKVKACVN